MVKLCDFGFARTLGKRKHGKNNYSFEQLTSNLANATDVILMACVCKLKYHIMTSCGWQTFFVLFVFFSFLFFHSIIN